METFNVGDEVIVTKMHPWHEHWNGTRGVVVRRDDHLDDSLVHFRVTHQVADDHPDVRLGGTCRLFASRLARYNPPIPSSEGVN